jgi:hypothetical protein
MRAVTVVFVGVCMAMLLAVIAPNARADEWNHQTFITFDQPVEIPGHVLEPGTYDFSLVNSQDDRNVVKIRSAHDQHVVAIILAEPIDRQTPANQTKITFEQLNPTAPKAIKDWFYPGSLTGQQFIYPSSSSAEGSALGK